MADKIYKQIEDKAGYHKPDVYELLTFHNAMFRGEEDSLSGEYYPLTATTLRSRTRIIPFVIGILPPSALVSGRRLDRSNSIGGPEAWREMDYEYFEYDDGEGPAVGSGGRSGARSKPIKRLKNGKLPPTRIGPLPLQVRQVEFNPAGKNPATDRVNGWFCSGVYSQPHSKHASEHEGYDFASDKGTPTYAVGTGTVVKVSNPSTNAFGGNAVTVKFTYGGKTYYAYYAHLDSVNVSVGQAVNPSVQIGTVGDTGNAKGTWPHLHFTIQNDKKEYLDPMAVLGGGGAGSPVGKSAYDSFSHSGGGEAVATGPSPAELKAIAEQKKAREARLKAAKERKSRAGEVHIPGKDPNTDGPGAAYQAQYERTVKAIQESQRQMAHTPPLQMLINPMSFSVSSTKVASDGVWARNGPNNVIEHWGDAQDTISAQGRVAGFYATDYNSSVMGSGPGLTRMARSFSASYQNLMSLYLIYRNNGYLWLEDMDLRGVGRPNNLALVGSVYLYYDNTMYIGSFDSFQVTEEAESPFTLSYSFEFTVRYTYLLDRTQPMSAQGFIVNGQPTGLVQTPVADPRYSEWAAMPPDTVISDG